MLCRYLYLFFWVCLAKPKKKNLCTYSIFQEKEEPMRINVGSFLSKRAMLSPNKEAMVYGDNRYTFTDLNLRSNRLASAVQSLGVGHGDRVAVLALNCPEYLDIYFGLGKIGAIMVPLNFRLAAPELEYIINDCEPVILIYTPEFEQVVDSFRNQVGVSEYWAISDSPPEWAKSYQEVMTQADDQEPEITGGGDDTLTILYTSGTTGRPKGTMLTHDGYFGTSVTLQSTFGEIGDILLMPLPLFHIGALAPVPMVVHFGAKLVLQRAFEPKGLLELINTEKPSWMGSVPQILMFLKTIPDYDKYDWSSLKMILVYAAPVPVTLIKEYAEAGIQVRQLYGLTECTGPATVLDADNALKKVGSCGLPFFHTEVRVIDDNGNDVPQEVNGEVILKANNLMKGYWKKPEATSETLRDGWLYTGDIARFDKDGFLYIMDRKKDMIISGGENIYPAEVEDYLLGHPKIADVGVIGYDDPKWGESVKAIVVLKPQEQLTEEELIEWCQGKIGKFKIPKQVVFAKEIPRTPTGKILKRVLRDQFN